MICELLTDEPEGGTNSIPMWMFEICYRFVAEMDCSETQEVLNGQKVLLNDGKLEAAIVPIDPEVFAVDHLRAAILIEWDQCIQSRSGTLYRINSNYEFSRNFLNEFKHSSNFLQIIATMSKVILEEAFLG